MSFLEQMEALGADTDEAVARFVNNSALYEKMLKKLPAAVDGAPVMPFMEAEDYTTALANAHTLKGVMSNLSVTPLYKAYADIVAYLRANDPASAMETLKAVLPIQEEIMQCIKNNS